MAFPDGFELPKKDERTNEEKIRDNLYVMRKLIKLPKEFNPTKLRVMSELITGKSVWGEVDGKRMPTRTKPDGKILVGSIGINQFTGEPEKIKDFIACVVWNYSSKRLEILETDNWKIIEGS